VLRLNQHLALRGERVIPGIRKLSSLFCVATSRAQERSYRTTERGRRSADIEARTTERKNTGFGFPGKEFSSSVIAVASAAFVAFFQNALVDFFPVHLDFGRRLDSDTYLISLYAQYCNYDIVTDDKFLPNPSCQYEHCNLPLVSDTSCIRWFSIFFYQHQTIARR
jgi:hypothetical protein